MRSLCDHDEPVFVALLSLFASNFRTRAALQAEILALRHQLAVLQKNAPRRLRLQRSDRSTAGSTGRGAERKRHLVPFDGVGFQSNQHYSEPASRLLVASAVLIIAARTRESPKPTPK